MKQFVITEEQLREMVFTKYRKVRDNIRADIETQSLDKVLDTLVERASVQSEYAELPCQNGWHTGDHSTEVVRISYIEREIDALRGVEE